MAEIRHFTEAERRRYYNLFINQTALGQKAFCRQYGLRRTTLRNWIKKYGSNENNAPHANSVSGKSTDKTNLISISQYEYQELQKIKFKYQTICSILNVE